MLTAELIVQYGIDSVHNRVSRMDDLFSGVAFFCNDEGDVLASDPVEIAKIDTENCHLAEDKDGNRLPYDIVVAICPNGNVVTQIIVFRTFAGYEKYLRDGIIIFDDKET